MLLEQGLLPMDVSAFPNSAVLVPPAYIMAYIMAGHLKDKGYLQRKILSKTQTQSASDSNSMSLVQAGDNLPRSPTNDHFCVGVSQVNQVNMSASRVSEKYTNMYPCTALHISAAQC